MGFSGSAVARLGALAMAGVSPAFVTFLLLKVGGLTSVVAILSADMFPTGLGCTNEREQVRQALRRPEGLSRVEEEHANVHSKALSKSSLIARRHVTE